jgi:hypothetical protein
VNKMRGGVLFLERVEEALQNIEGDAALKLGARRQGGLVPPREREGWRERRPERGVGTTPKLGQRRSFLAAFPRIPSY